jgi:hypothetical protein
MPDVPKPENLSSYISDLERRIRVLETAPRLKSSSNSDQSNVTRNLIGQFPDGGDFGFELRNPTGVTVFRADSLGLAYPRIPLSLTKAADYIIVTSGTEVTTWSLTTAMATADAIQIQLGVSADAATTGTIRIATNISGTSYTAAQAIPALFNDFLEWKWAPAGLVVGTGPIVYDVLVTRTSGAGNVNVYPPLQGFMATSTSIGATPTGI